MAEPTPRSLCWGVGGCAAPALFVRSSPTSVTTQRQGSVGRGGGEVERHKMSVQCHFKPAVCEREKERRRIFFPPLSFPLSSSLLPPKSANATQSQTLQWVHVCSYFSQPFAADRTLTVHKLSALFGDVGSDPPPPSLASVPTPECFIHAIIIAGVAYGGLCRNEQYQKGNGDVSRGPCVCCSALVLTGDVAGVRDMRG